MKMENNFEARQIGNPDLKKKNQIISAYNKLTENACGLQLEIERCLRNIEGFGVDFFMESLKMETGRYIKEKFVEINKVSIPGISTEKLIKSDLLDIDGIENAIEERKLFDNSLIEAKKTGFIYPLRLLNIDSEYGWELTEDFHRKLDIYICQFTQTEEQNFILERINQLCQIFNDLSKLKILRTQYGLNDIQSIYPFFVLDINNSEEPFSVSRLLFNNHRLANFRVNNNSLSDTFDKII